MCGAHADVLESLSTAVAIFDADGKLRFYNSEYSKQFGLDEEFLTSEPTLGEVLEALRERRRMPEYADFPKYKRELMRELIRPDRIRWRSCCICPTVDPAHGGRAPSARRRHHQL